MMATWDVLRWALCPLKDKPDMECSLHMDHPIPDTLGRFMNACCQQQGANKMEYPATYRGWMPRPIATFAKRG
jgi:hypothetical protein